jgi:hypothetical protein
MNGLYIHGHLITITPPEIVVGLYIDCCTISFITWWKKGKVIRKVFEEK